MPPQLHNKSDIINLTLIQNNFKSYLELGIGPQKETFLNIMPGIKKVGVDVSVSGENIIQTTTDEYFRNCDEKFDVIYIDADHQEQSVLKDFENALKHINQNGVIFLHDVGPETIDNTVLTASGTAYLSWIKIRTSHMLCTSYRFPPAYPFFNGDVIGIVIPSKRGTPLVNENYTWEFYEKNREHVLNQASIQDIESILTI